MYIVFYIVIDLWVHRMNAIMLHCGHPVHISSVTVPYTKEGLWFLCSELVWSPDISAPVLLWPGRVSKSHEEGGSMVLM